MADTPGIVIDRLIAGEMSAEEQRRLAQSALADPDQFDTLTAAALVQAALSDRDRTGASIGALPPGPLQPRRQWRTLAGAALAVAATIVTAFVYFRTRSDGASMPPRAAIVESVAIAPVLLTASAGPTPVDTFRSNQTSSRVPRRNGTIVAVRGGVVEVDVGALDGMSEGLQLQVLSPDGSGRGQLTITTVFRERARGRVTGGIEVRVGDGVAISATAHMNAVLEQAAARQAVGDTAAVQRLLELAASAAESREVSADLRRQAYSQLGALRHRTGELSDAERQLTLAVDDFETSPIASSSERADILNELGVVQIERRAYSTANRTLHSAESYAAGAAKMRILNNLGAIAALGGDRAAARSFYESARVVAGDSSENLSDRAAIQKNLNMLQSRP
jgi:hypothetical protein